MSRQRHFLDCGCQSCVNDLLKDIDRQATQIKAKDKAMRRCIKSMAGSNCDELHWLEKAVKC